MKKLSLIFYVIFFAPIYTYSQDLNALDEKIRFNKFKLESNFDIYIKDCKLTNTYPNKISIFKYNKQDIKSLLTVDIVSISLEVYNNKLYKISVSLDTTYAWKETDLLYKLQDLFGKAEPNIMNGTIGWYLYHWQSKKVEMKLTAMYDIEYRTILRVFVLEFESKQLKDKIALDNF